MIHRLSKEGIVYILIFCTQQILIVGSNPFGISLAVLAINMGYKRILVILAAILGNLFISAPNFIANIITLLIFSLFDFLVNRYGKQMHIIIKTIICTVIFTMVRLGRDYQDLSVINTLVLILEIMIIFTSCIVFSVGMNYIQKKDVTKTMSLQEKISLSFIVTLFGVYIIQVNNENITLLKIVIIYILSFLGTIIYKVITDTKKEDRISYGQVYNNLVHNKLVSLSQAVDKMSKSIEVTKDNDYNISAEQGNIIFEKISEKYCSKCDRCNYCWEKEYETTYEAANIMMHIGVQQGVLTLKDIPKSFLVRCKNGKEIMEVTNINLEIARNNMWWYERLEEIKQIMSMQLEELANSIEKFSNNMYNNISLSNRDEKNIKYALKSIGVYIKDLYCYEQKGVKEIIMTVKTHGVKVKTSNIAEEISSVLGEKFISGEYAPRLINNKIVEINFIKEEMYKISSAYISIKKEGEKYCGDNYSVIDANISQTYLALSDGMGCGKKAYKESKKTVEMLEELLLAGFSKEVAINLINSSMYIANEKENLYTTLDICEINRYNGICEFAKVGGMPSYIKRGYNVMEIPSTSLPIGVFNSTVYDREKISLQDGDIIIMMSDGLGDSMSKAIDWRDELLYIIKNIEVNNPESVAEYIIEQALSNEKIVDDVSILVGIVWKNNNI